MKKLTPKQNLTIANALMGAGVLVDLIDMFMNGMDIHLVPLLIAVGLVAIGGVWRYTMVKCPHCGDRFKGIHKDLPTRCPTCNGRLDK